MQACQTTIPARPLGAKLSSLSSQRMAFLGFLFLSCSMPLGCSIAQAKHFYMCVTFSICLGSEI
ncbi:MAG: hypothetical protein EBV34_22490, partial [Betaproteobacteria bacterium]|nr:hypothetical protein [Betaproteobacteria bacterium]